MKDVQELKSERIAIYPPGEIHLAKVVMGTYGGKLLQTFSFGSATPSAEEVELSRGFIIIDDEEILIPLLKIDDRRIILAIEGTAEQADAVAKMIGEIVLRNTAPEPTHIARATGCTVHMDFTWDAIYNEHFAFFLQEQLIPEIKTSGETPILSLALGRYEFRYQTAADLVENSISANPKIFLFGPEPRRPISEQRYVTQSPTRSEDHMRLLEILERTILGAADT